MPETERIGGRGLLICSRNIPGCPTYFYLIQGLSRHYVIDTGLGTQTAGWLRDQIPAGSEIVVVNTHYHWDHVWGNAAFAGAMIVAHERLPALLEQNWPAMLEKGGKWRDGNNPKVLPNLLISQAVNFADDGVEIFHTPGHTGDSLSVYDSVDKVLHVGDNLELLMPELYDTQANFVRSLQKYLTYDFSRCIAGHNRDIKREEIMQVLESVGPITR